MTNVMFFKLTSMTCSDYIIYQAPYVPVVVEYLHQVAIIFIKESVINQREYSYS